MRFSIKRTLSATVIATIVASSLIFAGDEQSEVSHNVPEKVLKAWKENFQYAIILETKKRPESKLLAAIGTPELTEPIYEIDARGADGRKFAVVFFQDGSIRTEDKHSIGINDMSTNVLEAAKKWADGAQLLSKVEIRKENDHPRIYTVSAKLEKKTYAAQIEGNGRILRADALPGKRGKTENEIDFSELPDAVRKDWISLHGNAEILKIEKREQDDNSLLALSATFPLSSYYAYKIEARDNLNKKFRAEYHRVTLCSESVSKSPRCGKYKPWRNLLLKFSRL